MSKLLRLMETGVWFSIVNALRSRLGLKAYFRQKFEVSERWVWLYGRRNTSDSYVYDQVINNKEYLPFSKFTNIVSIIDAGANVGYSSAYLTSLFPEAKIIAIEPDKSNYELLCKNMKFLRNVVPVHGAIWSKTTSISMSNEVFGDGLDWSKSVSDADGDVSAYTISDIIADFSLTGPLIIKMDIEGAETIVFRDGATDWLSSTSAIILEIHPDSHFGNPTDYIFQTMDRHALKHIVTNEGHMFYKDLD